VLLNLQSNWPLRYQTAFNQIAWHCLWALASAQHYI